MISTKNFTITELWLSDARALSELMVKNKSRFQRYFPQTLAQNLTVAASIAYIHKKQEEINSKSEFTWAIRDNRSKKVVGILILKELDWQKGQGEFAYCIAADFEGRGWVTTAVSELTNYAFTQLGLLTLQIIAHETNTASINVARNNDFTWRKKLLKSHTPPDGVALDMELYERYAN